MGGRIEISESAPMTNEAAVIPPNQRRKCTRERDEARNATRLGEVLLCCQSLNLLIRSD